MLFEPVKPKKNLRYFLSMGFGVFLIAIAALIASILHQAPHPILGGLAALALAALGVEHMVSTARGRDSWVSRIGPLP